MGFVDAVDEAYLNDDWLMKASIEVEVDGEFISTGDFIPENWYPVALPSTVLSALVKNGVYPDPRKGLNTYLIPDASDEFNAEHDLARYSYLPGKENPWTTPYWYRTEFRLPAAAGNIRHWLNFKGINYRADVWLNGIQIANHEEMAGAFQRYRFDITDQVSAGANNYLAVKIRQADHPGKPDMQLDVFGKERGFFKEMMKDVTLVMAIGYDCMPTVCDRNMGLWQEVCMDSTGPVDVRNPFVKTSLPLPDTSPARLTISAELFNATMDHQKGVLKGKIEEDVEFEKVVELGPGETKEAVFSPEDYPQLAIDAPRLWWPNNYGEQNLHNLVLKFEMDGKVSDEEKVTFGIREITKELYELEGAHGLRLNVNGKKIVCRGG